MRATIDGSMAARTTSLLAALLLVAGQGCVEGGGDAKENTVESAQASHGPTSFVSAEEFPTVYEYGEEEEEEEEEKEAGLSGVVVEEDDREFGEGDIYRVLGGGYLLNLNLYRGLQVIDVQNPAAPAIVGRLPVHGIPVELHVRDNRAVVVVNDWYGYKADPGKIAAPRFTGGAVLEIDIANRAAPRIVSEHHIPGFIRAAQRASGATKDTLYVAATQHGAYLKPDGGQVDRRASVLESFEVTSSAVVEKGELLLDGYVASMQSSGDLLLVARTPTFYWQPANVVSIVDVSGVDGSMALRGHVSAAGAIRSPLYMDLRGGKLRVLTGPQYSGNASQSCHMQTWDVSDLDNPVSVDQEDFSPGRLISGAAFFDDSAIVTTTSFYGLGAFHAFSIDGAGDIDEKNEVTAFKHNLHLRPVLGGSHVIGIEVEAGQLAVGLYDSTNLTNPSPLLAQARVDWISGGWSQPAHAREPRWYTLLENAVSLQAPTGETETGLLLMPFNGYNWVNGENVYKSGVQIFTFSSTTVTRRGFMAHQESDVRRAFRAGGSDGANLSDRVLSLYDQTDLDNPAPRGRLDLAPGYAAVLRFGDYRVRVRNREEPVIWYHASKPAAAEVIPAVGSAEQAIPVASVDVPVNARYFKVGDLLVAVRKPGEIRVYDLSDPTNPQAVGQGSLEVVPWYWDPTIYVTNRSLAFLQVDEPEIGLGEYEGCGARPLQQESSCQGQEGCTYWTGSRWCRTPAGGQQYCSGEFALCTDHADADPTCVLVPLAQAQPYIIGGCDLGSGARRVKKFQVRVVDLSNPASPTVAPTLTFPVEDEGVSALSDGKDLFVTVKQLATAPSDPRPHAKYYIKRIDLSQPAQPIVTPGINVPGELIAIDGATLFTRDRVWGHHRFTDSAVAKLELKNGAAELKSYQHLADWDVASIVVDENHLPVMTHSQIWKPDWATTVGSGWDHRPKLAILRPQGGSGVNGFTVLSNRPIQAWMQLYGADQHRLFFQVPGGTLLINADNPHNPKAQAFLFSPPELNPSVYDELVLPQIDGNDVLLPAGRIGIHQLHRASTYLP